MDATDLAGVIFTGGAVGDAGGAAVQVFEDDLLTLDDELTDTTCTATARQSTHSFLEIHLSVVSDVLPTKPVLMPAVLARRV